MATLAQQRAFLDRVFAKASNRPQQHDVDQLAERLAQSMTRSVAPSPAVSAHDALLIKTLMAVIAPYIAEMRDEVAELQERLDTLEARR